MRDLFISILSLVLFLNVVGQNLIPNPGFELGGCPTAQYDFGSTVMPTSWSQFPSTAYAYGADYQKVGCYSPQGFANNGNAWMYAMTEVEPFSINCSSGGCGTMEKQRITGVKATLTSTLIAGNSYTFSVSLMKTSSTNTSTVDGVGIWIFPGASPPSENSCYNPPNMIEPIACLPRYITVPPDYVIPIDSLTTSYKNFSYTHVAAAGDNTIGIAGWYGSVVAYPPVASTPKLRFCIDDVAMVVASPCGACVVGGAGTTWTWTGCQSTDWFNACNWDRQSVPTSTSDVIIPNTANKPLITGAIGHCRTLDIQTTSGARLDINSGAGGNIQVHL